MIAVYVALMAFSTVASVVFVREILLLRLDQEINNQFAQEVREFRTLLEGNDPRTGEPFGSDLKAIFDVYFSRNIPDEGETLLSFAGGRLYKWKRAHDAGYPLDELPAATDRWASLRKPNRGELTTPDGVVRYLAVPVKAKNRVRGTFVVANFPAFEQQEVDDAVRVAAGVTVSVLFIASLLAWIVTGRILAPLRDLTGTVDSISESDLTRRLPVRGPAEVSNLAMRFNHMLDRLDDAFAVTRQFADDAGHELRTPITIIRGHLEVLGDDPDEVREARAVVTDELDRMSRMVDDLLVLAKAQQPDFLNLETVDVGALTEELEAKASALGPRGWRLESAGVGLIVADRQRLTQAIMQLAQNAVQYTTEGDPISIGSAVAAGEARFWVRDSGPGIPHEEQERIFLRFSRGAGGLDRSEGAGLGLSIVQAIAEAHHGRVELRSRPGAGAAFTLVLPVNQPHEVDSESRSP
jgi:two-component system OmpR family sensor kinase